MKYPFLPKILPPELTDSEIIKLLNLSIEARTKLTEFNTLLERSIVSETAIMYFSLHESIESTKIEGTQATFTDIMESELTGKRNNDVQEVLNYLVALNTGVKKLDSIPISTRLFHQLHKIILDNSRGMNRSPGEYRRIQNFIGPTNDIKDATYIPPAPTEISNLMSNLEEYINTDAINNLDHIIRAGIIHAQFETIHPYLDGNGRLGRILIILYLIDKKVINKPSFFMSEELEKNKFKYYGLLNNLRTETPNWFIWLEFFVTSAIRQANKYIEKLRSIEFLYESMAELAKEHNIRPDIIESIFTQPFFKISDLQARLNISYNTANSHVNKLVKIGKIFADDKKRNRSYRFYDIIDILNN